LLLLVKLGVLLNNIVANIAVLLLDAGCLFLSTLLTAIKESLLNEVGHITTSQRNALDAGTNNIGVTNWEDVSNTITSVNDSTSHIALSETYIIAIATSLADLGIEGKSSLHTNEEALDIEGLKHDFGDLLTILWSVHRWLCEDKAVLFWLTSQVLMHGSVPVLLNVFPVADLTLIKDWLDVILLHWLAKSLVSNEEIELIIAMGLIHGNTFIVVCDNLVCDHRWDHIAWLHVASVSHLGVACTIINNNSSLAVNIGGLVRF